MFLSKRVSECTECTERKRSIHKLVGFGGVKCYIFFVKHLERENVQTTCELLEL